MQDAVRDLEIGQPINSEQRPETADGVARESEAEPGYRFYALYDKISREDILAHAYAQCRSNKGAPGVDRQDFEAVEAYGVERWLGELALALRQETYRPDPIPKANGKLRPLGISTLTGSGLHDGSDPPGLTRGRPSIGTQRLPSRAKRPAGGGRGGRTAVSRPSGSRGRRPRGLLREHSPCRAFEVGSAPDRRSARAASDQDVAGLSRGRNRRSRSEDTHDRGARQAARHSAGFTPLTAAGQYLHAPVRAGMEDVRA